MRFVAFQSNHWILVEATIVFQSFGRPVNDVKINVMLENMLYNKGEITKVLRKTSKWFEISGFRF